MEPVRLQPLGPFSLGAAQAFLHGFEPVTATGDEGGPADHLHLAFAADATGYAEVGRRDPVVGRVQAAFPGCAGAVSLAVGSGGVGRAQPARPPHAGCGQQAAAERGELRVRRGARPRLPPVPGAAALLGAGLPGVGPSGPGWSWCGARGWPTTCPSTNAACGPRRPALGSLGDVASSVSAQDLLRWSETLAAIARTGLGFTQSLYEQERFEEVLKVAADIRAGAAQLSTDGREVESDLLVEEWMQAVGEGVPGYVTPKVAVGAVVGNDEGELLLVKRADSGVWLYPTGWADVGYSASEVVVKEVWEETGIVVEPVRLIAVLDGLRLGFTRIPLYSLVFHCRTLGGELRAHPLECADVGWFAEGALPTPLAGAERWKQTAFAAIRGEAVEVLFDQPRRPTWREQA